MSYTIYCLIGIENKCKYDITYINHYENSGYLWLKPESPLKTGQRCFTAATHGSLSGACGVIYFKVGKYVLHMIYSSPWTPSEAAPRITGIAIGPNKNETPTNEVFLELEKRESHSYEKATFIGLGDFKDFSYKDIKMSGKLKYNDDTKFRLEMNWIFEQID